MATLPATAASLQAFDEDVPFAMSERYAAAGEAELVALDGVGHFELIDPQAEAFAGGHKNFEVWRSLQQLNQ